MTSAPDTASWPGQLCPEGDKPSEPEDHGDHFHGGNHQTVCKAGCIDRSGSQVRSSQKGCPAGQEEEEVDGIGERPPVMEDADHWGRLAIGPGKCRGISTVCSQAEHDQAKKDLNGADWEDPWNAHVVDEMEGCRCFDAWVGESKDMGAGATTRKGRKDRVSYIKQGSHLRRNSVMGVDGG